ncbi:MAG: anti-sigma regulatory factor [Balneola sp.]|nr:anti-sigma regulatory factor [Balneola sp.]MBU94824.1 anti-sigma regulatory factor [Balneola sp.]|tara:strand:- start:11102 stop:11539 length:438 start_codon:yes stop_codon:yes gene_type:complete
MSKETKPSVELRIPILKDMELVATNTADVIAKYMELSEEASGEISMALIEATINAFEHSESQKDIFINFTISDDELTIKVIDKGKGFDSEGIQIPDIDSKLKKQERKRGWGVMLIKELMDSVDYESGNDGTTLTMTKKKKNEQDN